MSRKHIIIILFFSILNASCSNDDSTLTEEACESIIFDDQLLKHEIDIFNIYAGVEKVIFVDNLDNEYEFEIVDQVDTMVYFNNEVICQEDTIYKSFYGQQRKMGLKGPEGLYIYFTHKVDYWKKEEKFDETRLVDYLAISQSKTIDTVGVVFSSWISLLTSDRGGVMNTDSLTMRLDDTELLQNESIMGKEFEEVYGNRYHEMYFSKEYGVVSFTFYRDKRVVFDRFE